MQKFEQDLLYQYQFLQLMVTVQQLIHNNVEKFSNLYFYESIYFEFLKMAKNSGFKRIELLGPGGKEVFNGKRDISLYALLYR